MTCAGVIRLHIGLWSGLGYPISQ